MIVSTCLFLIIKNNVFYVKGKHFLPDAAWQFYKNRVNIILPLSLLVLGIIESRAPGNLVPGGKLTQC
jgi:hypothetical protein